MSKDSRRLRADEVLALVDDLVRRWDIPGVTWTTCGSSRRRKADSNDVDMVATVDGPEARDRVLSAMAGRWGHMKNGKPATSGYEDGTRVEVQVTTREDRGAAILFKTGSGQFNVRMRARAKRRGFKLNRYGLFDRRTGARKGGRSELGIFGRLGLNYIVPALRTPDCAYL